MTQEYTNGAGTFASKLEERVVFFFVCVGIIAITYGFFFLIDFLPEKPLSKAAEEGVAATSELQEPRIGSDEGSATTEAIENIDPLPSLIIIDALEKEIPVLNPETDSIEALDNALLSGVVRHPDSADFQETGTVFLLGHSSYLPKVNNKNFQAFNGIQKLKWGDTIRLRSSDMEYV